MRAVPWAAACAFSLVLYWPGVTAWFQRDDFDWLGLRGTTLREALFTPKAQGTVRVLGERAYFLGLSSLFGPNPLAFRLCAFLTMFASLAFLIAIVRRLTRSALVAALSALFWLSSSTLAPLMTWSSAYNQILCGFFLLASLWLLERYLATGKSRYCAGQWLTFLAGFGANEIMTVYPALAAAYCLCRKRRVPKSVMALFLGSLLFVIVEFAFVHPGTRTGLYALHVDGSMFRTFLKHWQSAAGPGRLYVLGLVGRRTGMWLSIAIAAGLALSVWRAARARDWWPVFWLGWFVIVLAPVLPLRDHVVDYYAALASIGLAVLAASAFGDASRLVRAVGVVWVGIYVVCSVVAAREMTKGSHEDSIVAKAFVQELRRIDTAPIVVQSLTPAQAAAVDHAWRQFGLSDVRILPPAECSRIHRELGVAVYAFDGRQLTAVDQ